MSKPSFLVGLGLGCLISSSIAAFLSGALAKEALDEKREETPDGKLEPIEILKTIGPFAIPPLLLAGTGTVCLVKGNKMNIERGAAYMAAYALSDTTLREYRAKTKELVGEKKEQQIRDEVNKDILEKNPSKGREIIITGHGNYLCYDKISGRYFQSDIESLRRAENLLDRRMIDQMFVSLNELYLEIGLNPIAAGDNIGWHIDTGYIGMSFSSQLADDGQPCLVMECAEPQPRYV